MRAGGADVSHRCADPGLSREVALPRGPRLEHHRPAARGRADHPDRCRRLRGAPGIRPAAEGRRRRAGQRDGCGADPRALGPFGELHPVPQRRCLDRPGRDGLGDAGAGRLQPAAGALCPGPRPAPAAAPAGGWGGVPGWLHRPSLPRPYPGVPGVPADGRGGAGGVQRRCGEEPGGAAFARHRHDDGCRCQPGQPGADLAALAGGAGDAADPRA